MDVLNFSRIYSVYVAYSSMNFLGIPFGILTEIPLGVASGTSLMVYSGISAEIILRIFARNSF